MHRNKDDRADDVQNPLLVPAKHSFAPLEADHIYSMTLGRMISIHREMARYSNRSRNGKYTTVLICSVGHIVRMSWPSLKNMSEMIIRTT